MSDLVLFDDAQLVRPTSRPESERMPLADWLDAIHPEKIRHVSEFDGATITEKLQASADWARDEVTTAASIGVTGAPNAIAAVLDWSGLGIVEVTESINLQDIDGWGWSIRGDGTIFLLKTAGKIGFDLLGSRWGVFHNLTIYGHSTDTPAIGVCVGRLDTTPSANHDWYSCRITGYFTECCLHNFASEEGNYFDMKLHNRDESGTATAFRLDGAYHFPLNGLTEFTAPSNVANTPISCVQHTFYGCEFRNQGSGYALEIIQADAVRFFNAYAVANDKHAILLKSVGQNNIKGPYFDLYGEPTDIIPGHIELQTHDQSTLILRGFTLKTHVARATASTIKVGSAMNVIIQGADIQFDGGDVPPNGFIELTAAGNIEVNGHLRLPPDYNLSSIDMFKGILEIDGDSTDVTLPTAGHYSLICFDDDLVRYKGVHRYEAGFQLVDGVTAPGTVAGAASIYVDTADGDLKVKFGDGTVKVLAADT